MKKIVILHVFPDEKFFDSTASFFDTMPEVENRYFFYSKKKNHKFKYIKSKDKVKLFHNFIKYVKELRRKDLDFVIFHRLVGQDYLKTFIIKSKTKVIWWEWGYEIYLAQHHMMPLVNIDLYKPYTKEFVNNNNSINHSLISSLVKKLEAFIFTQVRRFGVSRVDFMIPTIPIDYQLMKQHCSFFKAEPLFNAFFRYVTEFTYHEKSENILVGNSLTYTNNHLDVFKYLNGIDIQEERKIIIPISYGGCYGGIDNFKLLSHINHTNILWLTELMSFQNYSALLKTVTHGIWGNLRQQAMGSIYYCLKTGVKIYLFKDSVIYKQFKKDGFTIFSIEDDLTTQSLSDCLPKDDAKRNNDLYNKIVQSSGPYNLRIKLENCLKDNSKQ